MTLDRYNKHQYSSHVVFPEKQLCTSIDVYGASTEDISDEMCSSDEDDSIPAAKCQDISVATSENSPSGIASFIESESLNSDKKYNLLVNHFKPGVNYSFPEGSKGHSFQYQWLLKFPWLVYSKQANGGFVSPVFSLLLLDTKAQVLEHW